MAKRDYYDVLGVPRDADEKTLKSAFRKLAIPGTMALLANALGFLVIMLIDIPIDVQEQSLKRFAYPAEVNIRGYKPSVKGNDLQIKRVAEALQAELPQLKTFCTLSPIPGFMAWLARAASIRRSSIACSRAASAARAATTRRRFSPIACRSRNPSAAGSRWSVRCIPGARWTWMHHGI